MSSPILTDPTAAVRSRRSNMSLWGTTAAALPLLLCLTLFVLAPLLNVITGSVGGISLDFSSYAKIITDPVYSKVLRRTFEIALVVTGLCVLLGYPVAYQMTMVGQRMAALMTAVIMVPLLTGVLIRMYAWTIILAGRVS